MFKAAKLSQDLSVTKSYFECCILSVMHTASYNRNISVILMLMQVGFYCMDINVTNGRTSHFFQADAWHRALEGEHTPH